MPESKRAPIPKTRPEDRTTAGWQRVSSPTKEEIRAALAKDPYQTEAALGLADNELMLDAEERENTLSAFGMEDLSNETDTGELNKRIEHYEATDTDRNNNFLLKTGRGIDVLSAAAVDHRNHRETKGWYTPDSGVVTMNTNDEGTNAEGVTRKEARQKLTDEGKWRDGRVNTLVHESMHHAFSKIREGGIPAREGNVALDILAKRVAPNFSVAVEHVILNSILQRDSIKNKQNVMAHTSPVTDYIANPSKVNEDHVRVFIKDRSKTLKSNKITAGDLQAINTFNGWRAESWKSKTMKGDEYIKGFLDQLVQSTDVVEGLAQERLTELRAATLEKGSKGFAAGGAVMQPESKRSPISTHHLQSLSSGKYTVDDETGDVSTVYTMQVNDERLNGGKPTLIPSVWDGTILDEQAAVNEAVKSGVEWPTADSHETLRAMDIKLHEDMGQTPQQATKELNKKYAEGGIVNTMDSEMSSMMQEAPKVDPVSGNEVPIGSEPKEVRDDIPAKLSEGEMVIPADVVRFFGVKYFMELRDKAKKGFSRMEEMGQFGNSDGKSDPNQLFSDESDDEGDDDLPFSLEDFDMQEESGDVEPIEAAAGADVQPNSYSDILRDIFDNEEGGTDAIDENGNTPAPDYTDPDSVTEESALAGVKRVGFDKDSTVAALGTGDAGLKNYNYLVTQLFDKTPELKAPIEEFYKNASSGEQEALTNYLEVINNGIGAASRTDGGEAPQFGGSDDAGNTQTSGMSVSEMANNPSRANAEALSNFGALGKSSAGRAALSAVDSLVAAFTDPASMLGAVAAMPGTPLGLGLAGKGLGYGMEQLGIRGATNVATRDAAFANLMGIAMTNQLSGLSTTTKAALDMRAALTAAGMNPDAEVHNQTPGVVGVGANINAGHQTKGVFGHTYDAVNKEVTTAPFSAYGKEAKAAVAEALAINAINANVTNSISGMEMGEVDPANPDVDPTDPETDTFSGGLGPGPGNPGGGAGQAAPGPGGPGAEGGGYGGGNEGEASDAQGASDEGSGGADGGDGGTGDAGGTDGSEFKHGGFVKKRRKPKRDNKRRGLASR